MAIESKAMTLTPQGVGFTRIFDSMVS